LRSAVHTVCAAPGSYGINAAYVVRYVFRGDCKALTIVYVYCISSNDGLISDG